MITYNFQNINVNYISYNLQCKILEDVRLIKTDSITIASFIIQDLFKNNIEIISFNASAEFIVQQNLKKESTYFFKCLNATRNQRFKRTNHEFKLIFEKHNSKVKKINFLEYKIKNQVFVHTKEDKKNSTTKQLSIKHFFASK